MGPKQGFKKIKIKIKIRRLNGPYVVWENRRFTEADSSFCPVASSYDAEIVAFGMALEWLMRNQNRVQKTLRIFIDNKGVIQGSLNMDIHSNQMESVQINLCLLHLLSETQLSKVYLTYCPSHAGIEGNERADDMASRTSPDARGPIVLKQHFTEEKRRIMNEKWRMRASTSEYRGRQWLAVRYNKKRYIPKIGSTIKRKRHFIKMADDDMETMARVTRGITNHAPTGEHNRRFFPEKPMDCIPSLVSYHDHHFTFQHIAAGVTTQYGLPHYAYMTRWTCSFSFYLPCSLLTLCSIHTDNLVPLYDTAPLPLCPCLCSTYDAVLILSIATSLFINTYASLYLRVYIPCTM